MDINVIITDKRKAKKKNISEVFNDGVLGRYIKHSLEQNVSWETVPLRDRYVMFPTEATLTIEFKNGSRTYKTFNINKDIFEKITKMNQKELMECFYLPPEDELLEKMMMSPVYINKQKFLIQSVWWNGIANVSRKGSMGWRYN